MKGNTLLLGLAFLLAAASVGVTVLAYQYVQLTRELNRAQWTVNQLELRQNRFRALINEAADFAQRNPSILPVLQSVGIRPTSGAAAPAPAAGSAPSGR